MSWILLLIQLIPTIVKIWEAIRDLIQRLPEQERPEARRHVRALARHHVRELAVGMDREGMNVVALTGPEPAAVSDFKALQESLKERVMAQKTGPA